MAMGSTPFDMVGGSPRGHNRRLLQEGGNMGSPLYLSIPIEYISDQSGGGTRRSAKWTSDLPSDLQEYCP